MAERFDQGYTQYSLTLRTITDDEIPRDRDYVTAYAHFGKHAPFQSDMRSQILKETARLGKFDAKDEKPRAERKYRSKETERFETIANDFGRQKYGFMEPDAEEKKEDAEDVRDMNGRLISGQNLRWAWDASGRYQAGWAREKYIDGSRSRDRDVESQMPEGMVRDDWNRFEALEKARQQGDYQEGNKAWTTDVHNTDFEDMWAGQGGWLKDTQNKYVGISSVDYQ